MGLDQKDVPVLEGYIALPDVAKRLKLSRQGAHILAQKGEFPSLRRVANSNIYLVKEEEIDAYAARQESNTVSVEDLLNE